MFFNLVWCYVLATLVARCGGVVLLVVFVHVFDGDCLLAHGAQLDVSNTVALMEIKGRDVNSPLAVWRENSH